MRAGQRSRQTFGAASGDDVRARPRLADPTSALEELLALLPDSIPSRRLPIAAAVGRVPAKTLTARGVVPPQHVAAWDGWALAAALTQGSGPYSPVPLPSDTPWLESGCLLPPGADAVLPDSAVVEGPLPQIVESIAPGEGVRRPGEDVNDGVVICRAGERLRATCLPALHVCGVESVTVHEPRISLICCGDELAADPARDGVGPFLAALLVREGAEVLTRPLVPDDAEAIASAIRQAAEAADLVLLVGGTGMGRGDKAAEALAGAGRLVLHGLGARPGTTAGFGAAGKAAIVLVPGRWDDAYAAWLLLIRPAVRRLTGMRPLQRLLARLTRKVSSAVGLLDMVPVRWTGPGLVEPLAVGALPPGVMAAADAVLLVPPAAEGYNAGADVELELL
jgi:molybdopterin molybdotransferase